MAYIRPYRPSAKHLREEKERIDLISSSEILLKWQVVTNEIKSRWLISILSSFWLLIGIPLAYQSTTETFINVSLISITLYILIVLYLRYLVYSDVLKIYTVTKYGAYSIRKQTIPDSAYKVVRSLGWILIAISILLIFIIGPVALVGAGGGVLLSFSLASFQPKITTSSRLFNKDGIILYRENITSFSFQELYGEKSIPMLLDIPEKHINELIKTIKNCTNNFEYKDYFEIEKIKPQSNIIREV